MKTSTFLLNGAPTSAPASVDLRAGALTLKFDHGSIRHVRYGGHEVLRQVYAAVRDHNWGTITPDIQDLNIDDHGDSFTVTFTAVHQRHDIDFTWRGTITGTAEGVITFDFDGTANSTFRRNRIGFCVLHPLEASGQPLRVEHVDGSVSEGTFPTLISPDQPFYNIRAVQHQAAPGVWLETRMEGDTFEMEDQRNWTDASFKTYCTPHDLPFPVTVEADTRIQQHITIRLLPNAAPIETPADETPLTITISHDDRAPLPKLGLGLAFDQPPLTKSQIERLKTLRLVHVRADLRPNTADFDAKFRRACAEAAALDAALELALHFTNELDTELRQVRDAINARHPTLARIIIFDTDKPTTSAETMSAARAVLGDLGVTIGGGTDGFFTELNVNRPPVDLIDFAVYSLNPQVHAFDDLTLVETLAGQAATVESARAFMQGKPVVVSPITFKMRSNPAATGVDNPTPPGELPPNVDPRQLSLFGAAWTVGSIKAMTFAGTAAVTYFETVGWLGVMENANGSPLPEKFPSYPNCVFPVYHIFWQINAFKPETVLHSYSTDPLKVDALVLHKADATRIIIVNYTGQVQRITLNEEGAWVVQELSNSTVEMAMCDLDTYGSNTRLILRSSRGSLSVTLPPFGIITLDSQV